MPENDYVLRFFNLKRVFNRETIMWLIPRSRNIMLLYYYCEYSVWSGHFLKFLTIFFLADVVGAI